MLNPEMGGERAKQTVFYASARDHPAQSTGQAYASGGFLTRSRSGGMRAGRLYVSMLRGPTSPPRSISTQPSVQPNPFALGTVEPLNAVNPLNPLNRWPPFPVHAGGLRAFHPEPVEGAAISIAGCRLSLHSAFRTPHSPFPLGPFKPT